MKTRHSLVVAAIVATLSAGASAAFLKSDEGVPHNLITAMNADEGVPQNLVTAMNADEGVPQNLITA